MQTALQIVKNEDTEDRNAKEQARAEKANKWTDPSSAPTLEKKKNRKTKSAVEEDPQKSPQKIKKKLPFE